MKDPRDSLQSVRDEVAKAVVGQDPIVWGVISAFLVNGHVILEGVPGVAKTLLVKSLAAALDLDFSRVQFTPDLMPSDVSGNVVYEAKSSRFDFRPGPIFANLVLADEINRTPPKTQAALLEAMEERQVSVEGEQYLLPDPFLVAATQNPVEFEGTYPLPEAQLDRFLLKLRVDYPAPAQELEVLRMHHEGRNPHDLAAIGVKAVATAKDLSRARAEVVELTVADEVMDYIVRLAAETRRSASFALGVSPRGAAMLLNSAKAWAYLQSRDFVTPDDVKTMLKPAWRHRVILRPEIELEGGTEDSILDAVVERVSVPK